ncbi:MAG: AsmA-like C-terminal region-containing protein [Pseudorhodobacter sp.]|nr:AsmA-like C-terminal region-containing protein [Pseudorhodobacter sp.]
MWLLLSLTALAALVGFGVMGLTGKTLRLPVWAVVEVETRLNRALDGVGDTALSLGAIEITVDADWVPRLRLQDVVLAHPGGGTILTLPEVRVAFDPGALSQGQVRARSLVLVGGRVNLRRDAEGRFDLELGAGAAGLQLGSLAEVLDAVDAAFALPALSYLRRIDAQALTLTLQDARARRVWQVGDGRLTLENRDRELAMELGFSLASEGLAPAQAALTFITRKNSPEARIRATVAGVSARDIAAQAPPLAWLGVLDAPISGQFATAIDDKGRIGALQAELTLAAGALHPNAETLPIAFERSALSLNYDPARERINLTGVTVESPQLRFAASGHVDVPGAARGQPREFLAQVHLDQVRVDPAGMFVEPVTFSEGALDLRLRLDPFRVEVGQLALVEDGQRLVASGRVTAEPKGWNLALDLHLDAIRHDRLLALWPVALVPRTRAWLAANVQEGLLTDVRAALRLAPEAEPKLSLGYEFAGVDVRFIKTMPPIRKGHGYATIDGASYTMVLDQGQVTPPEGGVIDMAGTVFAVLDILQRPPQAEIRLITDSSLTAALSLLDEPPFGFMAKAGQAVALGEGRARLDTVLRLPLKEKITLEDITYQVNGQLSDVRSTVLVPGRELVAPALVLTASRSGMAIAGAGKLGAVPFEVTYTQGFAPEAQGRSAVAGTVELSPLAVAEFGLGLPDGMVRGSGLGQIALALERGQAPRLTLTSDLTGIALSLPEVGWAKLPDTTGRLLVEARLGTPPVVDRLEVEAKGLSAKGGVILRPSGGLAVARFDPFRVGDWLDAAVELTGRGPGRAVDVALTGGRLDLRRMTLGASAGGGDAGSDLKVALDRVTVSDGIALTGFKGSFSPRGGFNGSFTAKVNDQAAVLGTVVPSPSGSAVRITSQDAGAVLAAAGIFTTARGGALDLSLIPTGPDGYYTGTAKATDLRVVDAPVLAALLSAVSVVGILEQLNGDGLVFSQADAEFRLTPEAVEVTRGAAVGLSLGVSMAGLYYINDQRLRLQGVISPFYLLNGIGAILTQRGEGLFGFNYKLRGTADEPRISVNPLSILTPGMFREIFRHAPPTIKDAP